MHYGFKVKYKNIKLPEKNISRKSSGSEARQGSYSWHQKHDP